MCFSWGGGGCCGCYVLLLQTFGLLVDSIMMFKNNFYVNQIKEAYQSKPTGFESHLDMSKIRMD